MFLFFITGILYIWPKEREIEGPPDIHVTRHDLTPLAPHDVTCYTSALQLQWGWLRRLLMQQRWLSAHPGAHPSDLFHFLCLYLFI